jgi:hypothetical protein
MPEITLERGLVERIARFTNAVYGDLEQGQRPQVDLDEAQEVDELIHKALNKKL